MITWMTLLLACGDKSTDTALDATDDTNTETTNTEDTDLETDPSTDNDGDGVIGAEDCDDANPWVSEDCGRACTGDFDIEADDDLTLIAGCRTIEGNLNIDGITTTNMMALNGLESVSGYFWLFRGENLVNLKGLDKLSSVNDGIIISYNSSLETLEGLAALTNVGGTMSITQSPMLVDLSALGNLTTIERTLMINSIAATSLDAFSNLQSVGASIYISECPNLETISGLATNMTSFGTHESIGTYDSDAMSVIESLLYVYLNDALCQDDVDATATMLENIGWEGRSMGYDNNGTCN